MKVRLQICHSMATMGLSDTFARTFDPQHGKIISNKKSCLTISLSKFRFENLPIPDPPRGHSMHLRQADLSEPPCPTAWEGIFDYSVFENGSAVV